MNYPKPEKPWRSEKYRAWIKKQPCIFCGNLNVDAHHHRVPGDGISQKPSDKMCLPVCWMHHIPYIHSSIFPGWAVLMIDPVQLANQFYKTWEAENGL